MSLYSAKEKLAQIYQPIEEDLTCVEGVLKNRLHTQYASLCRLNDYVLSWGGKRLRPALVMLSARSLSEKPLNKEERNLLVLLGAAIELIHTASLIHDDIIDDSPLRRNKPAIHSRWGREAAIAFGDYVYAKAFELVASCDYPDVLSCVASAASAMCEGQLFQVLERDNLKLDKNDYLVIVKKKTARLMAACCRSAALIINKKAKTEQEALAGYGLNFGIAFQIVDDYMDIIGNETLGKVTGQDIAMGELTLPLYDLLDSMETEEKEALKKLILNHTLSNKALSDIREKILNKKIFLKTKKKVESYIGRSKHNLGILKESSYKKSLFSLADYVVERGFANGGL